MLQLLYDLYSMHGMADEQLQALLTGASSGPASAQRWAEFPVSIDGYEELASKAGARPAPPTAPSGG